MAHPCTQVPGSGRHWLMIAETIFLAETFYAYSVIFFRQEKSFQDLS
jgi:hypothetical protein